MALTVEDGTGIQDADSYVSSNDADTYWGNRQHNALYTTWNAASPTQKEGALREATSYIDGIFGPYFRGIRRGYVQGLLWPRSSAYDAAGYELPGLPQEIIMATAELAARALSSALASDDAHGGAVKRQRDKVDVIETETEYFDGAPTHTRYGIVSGILDPVLNGSQPDSQKIEWNWR